MAEVSKLLLLLVLLLLSIQFDGTSAKKKKSSVKISTESRPSDCSDEASVGDTLTVHYTGALESGQVFDTSKREGREPFKVTLGKGQVIPGWEEGLLGMCIGEERKLVIPPHLAYGDRGIEGVIPPESTLVFHVELLNIEKPPLVKLPSTNGLYTLLAVIAVVGFIGYELYKRANSQSDDSKPKKSGGKKKSKKR